MSNFESNHSPQPISAQRPLLDTPEYGAAWSHQHKRKISKEQNAAMREIIKPWAYLPSIPPGCRAVSYSSWTKFSPSSDHTKSKADLSASVLCNSSGTSSDYNPPLFERTYLGVDQPEIAGNPELKPRDIHRRRPNSGSSRPTASSCPVTGSEAITFRKVSVRTVSTSSLLTESLRSTPGAGLQRRDSGFGVIARELKARRLSASMLPSAFDSDSEDDE